jgi:nucleoside-diphosphate-sugar epimerase
MEDNRPGFDVIHVLPSVILGRNELSTVVSDFASGTNRYVINIALGLDSPTPMLGASVFVNDCAEIHVLALDDKVKGSQNFIATGGAVVWNDVSEIMKSGFSEEVKESVLKLGGKLDTKPLNLDASETDKVFRVKWATFEQQVKSVVGHYLEVVTDEN